MRDKVKKSFLTSVSIVLLASCFPLSCTDSDTANDESDKDRTEIGELEKFVDSAEIDSTKWGSEFESLNLVDLTGQDGQADFDRFDTTGGLTVEDYYTSSEVLYETYKPLIHPSNIGLVDTSKTENTEHYRTYLGTLTDLTRNDSYHVIRDFWTIQLAISKRGHSEVIFIRDTNNFVVQYDLEMPEELPVSIFNNTLIFEKDGEKYGWQFQNGLSFQICLPWNVCYGIIEE